MASMVPGDDHGDDDASGDGGADCVETFRSRRPDLEEGMRVGRFLVVRDVEGALFGIAASAASVLRSTDDGTLMLLPGGRILHVCRGMATVMAWLDGRS